MSEHKTKQVSGIDETKHYKRTVGRPKARKPITGDNLLIESQKPAKKQETIEVPKLQNLSRANWFTDATRDKEAIKVLEDVAIAGLCGNEIDFKGELEKIKAILSK